MANRSIRKILTAFVTGCAVLGTLACGISSVYADVIEFLSGAKAEGEVKKIDKDGRTIEFDLQVGDRSLTRTYPYDKIHAVTMGEKRYVLNPRENAPLPSASSPRQNMQKSGPTDAATTMRRR